ncbi:MAG: cysteine desulfurase family protein [Microgenomates group bacterium]
MFSTIKKVYLDYAATTPVDKRVLKVMLPYFSSKFGNPSSIHLWGQEARKAVEEAREKVARILNCFSSEVYFTGTTTTSVNLAIQGVMKALKEKGKNHLITSAVEHHAVLDTAKALEREGFKLTILPVDKYGKVDPKQLEKAINSQTGLITIMSANNEVGTIQPIKEIGKIIKKFKTKIKDLYFHTDAATIAEYFSLDVKEMGVDLLSLGAHKFHGPKGVGILYVKKGVPLKPITFGGHHENGLWPGTEAVPLIVGAAEALKIAQEEVEEAKKRVEKLRDKLIKGVLEKISGSYLTGHPKERLPDIASFVFENVEGEAILLALSDKGIAASSGSACTSGLLQPSHVLTAMGISPALSHGSVRFSLGKETTEEEIDYVLEVLPPIIERLRKMAPKD